MSPRTDRLVAAAVVAGTGFAGIAIFPELPIGIRFSFVFPGLVLLVIAATWPKREGLPLNQKAVRRIRFVRIFWTITYGYSLIIATSLLSSFLFPVPPFMQGVKPAYLPEYLVIPSLVIVDLFFVGAFAWSIRQYVRTLPPRKG